jgi:uncharacterized protein (AIM24 family)
MAVFEIQESQRQRWVRVGLDNESVRAEAGALSYLRGAIQIDATVPWIGTVLRSTLSDEPLIRPRYVGTGEIFLNSTFGGFHVIDVEDEAWILENGAYWCSEHGVQLGLHREPMLASWRAGEGFFDFQTKLSGRGRAVVNAAGPVEEITLNNETIGVEGKLVIGRTAGVGYRVARPTRSWLGYWLSDEQMMRSYSGTGKILLVSTAYWNPGLAS